SWPLTSGAGAPAAPRSPTWAGSVVLLRKSGRGSEREHGLVVWVFEVNWGAIVEGAMEAGAIIKGFDKIEEGQPGLGAGLEVTAIDEFLFEGAPEGFHGGVVIAAGGAAHGGEGAREG